MDLNTQGTTQPTPTEGKPKMIDRIKGFIGNINMERGAIIALCLYLFGGQLVPDRSTIVGHIQGQVCSGYQASEVYQPPTNPQTPTVVDQNLQIDTPTPKFDAFTGEPLGNAVVIEGDGDGAPQQRLPR